MKLGKNYFEEKKSSFLSMDKDLALITEKIMNNQTLLKLLYYSQQDYYNGKDLTPQEIYSMLHKQIKIIPRIVIEKECPNYIIISFGDFKPNATNPEFRDCSMRFDILCHPDHWNLGNFALRPYKIAGEIDHMINGKKFTGIGIANLTYADNLVLNDQLMGFTLIYRMVHGIEDEINPLGG